MISEGKNILSKNVARKIYSTLFTSSDDEFKKFQGIFENGTYFQLSVFGVNSKQGFDDAGDGGNGVLQIRMVLVNRQILSISFLVKK